MSHAPDSNDRSTSDEPIEGSYFVSTYPPFSTWTREQVAAARRRLDEPKPRRPDVAFGLYVHVPFCAERCRYCYYLSYTGKSADDVDEYIQALAAEASMYARLPALANRKPSFVYFGGGTPSLPSEVAIEHMIQGVRAAFPWTDAEEVTFECAPQSVTEAKLRLLEHEGVTRISMGVQAFDDAILELNGRVHLVRDVELAYAAIRRVGFATVNIDLIVGLLGESDESFGDTVDRAIQMAPESVTIYQLEIPLNTPLYRAMQGGRLSQPPPSWEVKRARLAAGFERLEHAGYVVRSAYAAVRDPGRHPFVYQDAQYSGADLLGIGVASFSYLDGVHHQNIASLGSYIASVRRGELPMGRAYALSDDDRVVREFVLQLKLGHVESARFRAKFGVEITDRFGDALRGFAEKGWCVVDNDGVTLTRDGLLRVDRMIPEFYPIRHQNVRYS
ncbi:MAG: coproporphyrinogen III oxidase family protein [Planctomycetes bacterium]|nr:coproporphyrinogen III oxidase family protein [Planctomycetota bacterium]